MKYDYLIVGAGLFGATLANLLTHAYDKSVLVIEKTPRAGGMCYTERKHGITVHRYGAHIFRTDKLGLWNYVNEYSKFKPFVNAPLAHAHGELFNLPFNMNTFKQLWGVLTPNEARYMVENDQIKYDNPKNLEEYALSTVGKTIYTMFIKEYTEKQWGKKCTELPPSILGRLPLRFTYDNNYYSGKQYQGIPEDGYTSFIMKLLNGSDVVFSERNWKKYDGCADRTVFTGSIDEYYNYKYGKLEYRSLRFEEFVVDMDNVLGNAVINHTTKDVPYTREIEHKHFLGEKSDVSILSYEYPELYDGTNERYYPIETDSNKMLYCKYAQIETDTIFAGRLGSYKYTDMEQTILNAMELAKDLCE